VLLKDSAVSYCFLQNVMMVLNDLVCPLILVRVEGISKDLHPRAWVNVLKQVQKNVSSLCQWKMHRSSKSKLAVNI